MIIGIYNVFTVFWFLLMIGAGGTMAYLAISGLLTSDLIIIAKFFLVLLILIVVGVLIFLIIKFRILFITKTKIISFYPLRFRLIVIEKKSIKSLKWYTWEQKGTLRKSLKIKTSNKVEVEFSDFEFENFSQLESAISEDVHANQQRWKVMKEQAESNLGLAVFSSVIYFVFSICIMAFVFIKQEFHWVPIGSIMIGLLFSYIEAKKTIKYRRIKRVM